jgi:hypothetical protein
MYKEKYIKYKTKYLELKSQIGGGPNIIQEGGGRWLWSNTKVVPVDTFPRNYPVETPPRDYPWGRWPWSNTTVVPVETPPRVIPVKQKFVLEKPNRIIYIIKSVDKDKSKEILAAFSPKGECLDDLINIHLNIKLDSPLDTEFEALIKGLGMNTTIKYLILTINELSSEKYTKLGNAIIESKGIMGLEMQILDKNKKMITLPNELITILSKTGSFKEPVKLTNEQVEVSNDYIYAMFLNNKKTLCEVHTRWWDVYEKADEENKQELNYMYNKALNAILDANDILKWINKDESLYSSYEEYYNDTMEFDHHKELPDMLSMTPEDKKIKMLQLIDSIEKIERGTIEYLYEARKLGTLKEAHKDVEVD